jgi:hypothetical protein
MFTGKLVNVPVKKLAKCDECKVEFKTHFVGALSITICLNCGALASQIKEAC